MRKSFSSIIYGIHLPIEELNLCFEEHRTKVFEMYPNVLTFYWGKYRLKIPENMAGMVTFTVSQGQTAFTALFAGLRLVASYSSSGSLFFCDAKFGLFILVLLQFSSCSELFSVEMRNIEKQCFVYVRASSF